MPNPNKLIREAVVLVGGFGTRLAPEVPGLPKPMAPVVGRPFLRFVLDQLAAAGVLRVVIADGYRREAIEDFFGGSYRGMQLVYSPEDEPLGTGGAAKQALFLCEGDWVYLLNGDSYCDLDFDGVERMISSAAAGINVVVCCAEVEDASRYGCVAYDPETREMRAFAEKGVPGPGAVNAGAYALKRAALDDMPHAFSLERDWLERETDQGNVSCFVSSGVFIDIGVPEDYRRAQELLAPLARGFRIAFFDRDGTINVDTGHLFEKDKLALIDETVEIMSRYTADPEWKIVVVTNQAGIAKGLYSEDEMHTLHRELDRRLYEQGILVDAYYFCPHHPDFTGDCDCRKPKPGMLLRAMRDFDAVPGECVMYGDKEIDCQAARAAGVQGSLV